ncbi:MAG: CHAT domain-containing protein [Dehalococcoidia bacterium]|nr:CHAT domain-containing protein [Dehalococcoidia bacterium]
MSTMKPYRVILEFSRAQRAGRPHAFEFVPQTYLLRGPGGSFESAEFPWTPELLADLRAARIPGRDPAAIHRIGDTLRDFLAGAGWNHHEHAIVRSAHEGAPIFITIRSAAAELYALPWEFVALKSTGQLLGGVPGLLVRYEWPEADTFPDRVDASSRCSRVLLAWSAAAGAVPAAGHLAALQDALATRPGAFDATRDVLAHATYGSISRALAIAARTGPPIDVVHVLCHGASVGGTYGLALDDESRPGEVIVVDAGRMQQLFAPYVGMVRMVVLAACDSGNSGQLDNHLGSVAQMLHRAGVQAVVASRFPLSTLGSTSFARSFYDALVHGRASLEDAFLAAREALLRDPSQLDWASVQLYSRDANSDATYPLHLGDLALATGPMGQLATLAKPVSEPSQLATPRDAPAVTTASVTMPEPVSIAAPAMATIAANTAPAQSSRAPTRRWWPLATGVFLAGLVAMSLYTVLGGTGDGGGESGGNSGEKDAIAVAPRDLVPAGDSVTSLDALQAESDRIRTVRLVAAADHPGKPVGVDAFVPSDPKPVSFNEKRWRLGEDDPGAAADTRVGGTREQSGVLALAASGKVTYRSDSAAADGSLSVRFGGAGHLTGRGAELLAGIDLTDFELTFDAKPTGGSSFHIPVALGRYGSGSCFIYHTGGSWRFHINGTGDVIEGPAGSVKLNQWQNLRLIRRDGLTRLVADGAELGSSAAFPSPSADLTFGAAKNSRGGPDGRFIGLLDNVIFSSGGAGRP